MKYVIQTRQKPDGKGWCSGTIEGYDYSFASKHRSVAQAKMLELIKKKGLTNEVKWEMPQYYSKNGCMGKQCLIASTTRLTH